MIRLVVDLASTRLLYPGARIVRRPVRLRGRRRIALGRRLTVGIGLRIDAFGGAGNGPLVRIGDDVEINDHVHIAAVRSVTIGDNALIASRVFISDHNHGDLDGDATENGPDVPPAKRPLAAAPVSIGARVWIGEGAMILPGVTIGDGAIVGGGSVVTRDVAAATVVAGVPARVVRRFDPVSARWERVRR
ncbi:DapH/DapD/GlmU-related protein [uncultured Sphingomonas sp.]|uniref:DapH/DapD/GlmU-related protein n=1 Tax=uncultured Sphingomonas sp. TaxID=158754 RepID=UPI00259210F8|nr:DapH/DapD/GlmU-related protein [uncultured Sphingomonas sp.]